MTSSLLGFMGTLVSVPIFKGVMRHTWRSVIQEHMWQMPQKHNKLKQWYSDSEDTEKAPQRIPGGNHQRK